MATGRWLFRVWTATQQLGSFSHLERYLLAAESDSPTYHHQRDLDKRRCRAGSEAWSSRNYCVQSWRKTAGWRTCHCKWENRCPNSIVWTFVLRLGICTRLCIYASGRLVCLLHGCGCVQMYFSFKMVRCMPWLGMPTQVFSQCLGSTELTLLKQNYWPAYWKFSSLAGAVHTYSLWTAAKIKWSSGPKMYKWECNVLSLLTSAKICRNSAARFSERSACIFTDSNLNGNSLTFISLKKE